MSGRSGRARLRGLWVFAAIIGGGIALAAAWPLYNAVTGAPTTFDHIDAARRENRPLFESLGLPPGAKPHGPLEEHVRRARRGSGLTIELHQEFAIAGAFAEVLRWYEQRLGALGWKPFDRASWRDFTANFCRAPWMLTIDRRGDFSNERPPHHRFALRLEWIRGFGPERCPLP